MLEGSRFQVGLSFYAQFCFVLQLSKPYLQALHGAFGILQLCRFRVALFRIGLRSVLQLMPLLNPQFAVLRAGGARYGFDLRELAGLHRSVRGMDPLRAVFDEHGVNLQVGPIRGDTEYDVTYGDGSNVRAALEMRWRKRLLADLVKRMAGTRPRSVYVDAVTASASVSSSSREYTWVPCSTVSCDTRSTAFNTSASEAFRSIAKPSGTSDFWSWCGDCGPAATP